MSFPIITIAYLTASNLMVIFPLVLSAYTSYSLTTTSLGIQSSSSRSPPWADKHLPPIIPSIPPFPPTQSPLPPTQSPLPPRPEIGLKARSSNPSVRSVCTLPVCSCKSRVRGGKEVVDIECVCNESYRILTVSELMLPVRADTLAISDCDQVQLTGATEGLPSRGGGGWGFGRAERAVGAREAGTPAQEVTGKKKPEKGRSPLPLSSLSVSRVGGLILLSHAVGPVLKVRIDNVKKIPVLPPYAFQPPPSDIPGSNNTEAKWRMHSVTFRNVSQIRRVAEFAFLDVAVSSHFLWIDVSVEQLVENAVRVLFPADHGDTKVPCVDDPSEGSERKSEEESPCEVPRGSFALAGSVIGTMGIMSFNVFGARVVSFDSCHITQIGPSSISVHGAHSFSFTRNYVFRSVSMYGFDVVASSVDIRRNRFGRLEENALAGIRPLDSGESGDPSFDFADNLLEEVDLMSLNVGWKIFSVFSSKRELPKLDKFFFRGNSFADCSCPHVGWITQVAVDDEDPSSSFYVLLLNDDSGNYCAREPVEPMGLHLPCRLPLKGLASLFEEDGKTCKRHVNAEEVCAMYSGAAASKCLLSYHRFVSVAVLCLLFMAPLLR